MIGIGGFQARQKTRRQVAVADAPLLHADRSLRRAAFFDILEKLVGQGVGQPVIATGVSLEMVVDSGTLDPVENGVDVRLPLVRGFEIAEGQKL